MPSGRHATGDAVRAGAVAALVGLVGGDSYGREGEAALDEIQRALDLLTDTLLSHLAYEERELLHPLARHGFG